MVVIQNTVRAEDEQSQRVIVLMAENNMDC